MKPADFDYLAPTSLREALSILASGPGEARVMAGGQSLLPLMKARLASPSTVVDLGCIPGLDQIELRDGALVIGAMVLQATALRSGLVRTHAPLLAGALRSVGSPAIRNRGTVGGSAAHADPAAEIPAALVALDATFTAAAPGGAREIPARLFYRYAYETALRGGEILTCMRIPIPEEGGATGVSFYEVAVPRHNFALAGAAASLTVEEGLVREVRIALCGLGATPLRAREAEAIAAGCSPSPRLLARVARAAAAVAEPLDDVLASAAYRRSLAPVVVRRALEQAVSRSAGR